MTSFAFLDIIQRITSFGDPNVLNISDSKVHFKTSTCESKETFDSKALEPVVQKAIRLCNEANEIPTS